MNKNIISTITFCLLAAVSLPSHASSFAGEPQYQEIIAYQKVLSEQTQTITNLFDAAHAAPTNTTGGGIFINATSAVAKPVTVVQTSAPAPKLFGQANQTLPQVDTQYNTLLGTATSDDLRSYLGLLTNAWGFYTGLLASAKKATPVDSASIAALQVAPFQVGSLTLSVYTGLVGSAITYITKRLTTIDSTNYATVYGTTDAATLLQKELAVIDQAVEAGAATFKKNITTNSGSLVTSYQTIQQNYYQRKVQLLLQAIDPLVTGITTAHTMSVAQNGKLSTDLNMQTLNTLVQILFSSLSVFPQTQPTTLLGKYNLPSDVVTALSQKLASLFLYQAQVYQNVIEYNMQLWGQPGAVLTPFQQTTITNQIQSCQSFFTSAAQYYAACGQTTAAQGYAQNSGALQNGLSYWQTALTTAQQGYLGQAAQSFDQASTQCSNAQCPNLGFYLYQQFQQALFAYDQSIIATYGNYYISALAGYIAQAQKVPTGQSLTDMAAYHQTFQSFFYPLTDQAAQNATYKGIAWLAQSALPSFKEILNTLQTLSATAQQDQKQFLQQGITLLQTLSEGSSYLFYTSPQIFATGTAPADENSASYTVQGLVQALEQYNVISGLFAKADAVVAQAGQQNSLPFTQLFPQGSITNWQQFIMLHQAYWLVVCAEQAVAYAGSCSSLKGQVSELVSFAAIAFVNAQGLYRSLNVQPMVAYIQAQLEALTTSTSAYGSKTLEQLLQQKATTFMTGTPTLLNVQCALSCYQAGGLLGFASSRQNFFATLDTYKQQLTSSTSATNPFTGFALAACAVQGLYAQQAGWQPTSSYDTDFSQALARFTTDITNITTAITNAQTAGNYQQAITQQKALATFYSQYQAFQVQQERSAALYGLTTPPYLTVALLGNNNMINFVASTLKDPLTPQPVQNPEVGLAALTVSYAESQFLGLQAALTRNTFSGSLSDQIGAIEAQYNQAITYYSAVGMQNQVISTEQLKTKAVAALYFGLVIPSEETLAIPMQALGTQIANHQVTQQTFSNTGVSFDEPIAAPQEPTTSTTKPRQEQGAFFASADSETSKTQTTKTTPAGKVVTVTQAKESALVQAVDPLYLLRTITIDITQLVKECIAANTLAQAVTQSSSLKVVGTTTPDASPLITFAQQVLTAATARAGKTITTAADIQDLITAVLVPLYTIQLQQEGYTGFLTSDQAVQKYQNQLQKMMTQGLTVKGIQYVTQYVLSQQKNSDGTTHIILQGTNVPLDAIVQYQNQTQSALVYYTLCSKFYTTTQPTVSVNDVVYMTVSDPKFQATVDESVQRTYLAGIASYLDSITQYVNSLQTPTGVQLSQATLAQKNTLDFNDYKDAYTAIGNMFVWALSLLDSIQQVQQTAGVSYVDVNQKQYDMYVQYAQVCSYFLMGDPTSSVFQSILKDVANNYYMAAQSESADQTTVYAALAKVYEDAGDYACTINQQLPQVDGYPNPAPAGDPTSGMLITGQTMFSQLSKINVSCAATPVQELYPASQPLTWQEYQQASAYYQQAYTMYQNAYGVTSNLLLNEDIARTYGKFFYYDFFSALQAFSLFARNAYSVGFDQKANAVTGSFSDSFQNMVQAGSSAGVTQVTQAMAGNSATDADVSQKYQAMRSLLLNSLIYMTGVQGALTQVIKTVGVGNVYPSSGALSNKLTLNYGTLLQCSLTRYIPGLQTLIGGSNINIGYGSKPPTGSVDTLKSLIEIPSYLVDLQNSLEPIFQSRVFHADTFLTAMQYVVENTIGSPTNVFALLASPANSYLNLLTFNNLVTELWSMMRDAYGQAFLPDLYAAKNITAYENAIDSAIQGQQQELLINPASYIG